MSETIHDSDVLILGGGMAGGLMAALLADTGLSVTVLDGAPVPAMPNQAPTARVSAITEASHWLLRHAGAWQYLPAERLGPYQSMHVWDGDGTGEVCFDAAGVGAEQLGWIIENDAIVAALHQAVAAQENVQWLPSVRVRALRRDNDLWQATAGGLLYRAPLLIGADGARSLAREAAGISAPVRDTGHRALVATVKSDKPHGGCARQRFMETGPLALLPLFGDGQQSSLVWSLWPEEARRLMALSHQEFERELTLASEECLGQLRVPGELKAFPIRELHASEYVREGLALIGDAAHVVHPLAGQGINLGMLDAGVLAEEIHQARSRGLNHFDDSLLRRYQRRRRAHNALMQRALGGFKMLFEQRSPEIRLVRNLGMRWVNRLSPVKHMLAREALGRGGDLPRRARP
jgi:2-octaprenylphenol hydroxylase